MKGKGPMETYFVAPATRSRQHQAKARSSPDLNVSCTSVAASNCKEINSNDTPDKGVPNALGRQVPLHPYSLMFESSAAETAFQEEYATNNLQVANASSVLVILFLLLLVCLTGCWFWLRFLNNELPVQTLAYDGSATEAEDDRERQMQLAWLIVVGNTLLAAIMVVQLQCSASVPKGIKRYLMVPRGTT